MYVSVVVPVLVTFAWKLVPGGPEFGCWMTTWMPPAVTMSVPPVVPVTDGSPLEIAVTVNG